MQATSASTAYYRKWSDPESNSLCHTLAVRCRCQSKNTRLLAKRCLRLSTCCATSTATCFVESLRLAPTTAHWNGWGFLKNLWVWLLDELNALPSTISKSNTARASNANADAIYRYPVRVSAVSVVVKWFSEFTAHFVKQQAHDPITFELLTFCKKAQPSRQERIE